jgi:membrane protein implicated in regulation of membrane protease activity
MTRLIGKTAEVTVGIPQGGMGQVTLEYGGERTTQIARSKDGGAIAPGTGVVVTDLRGDSIIVEPIKLSAPGGSS